ncbi:hypothetical protein V6N13_071691 [Hibiscus sabdariffa]|uniref:Translation initiation factor eIF2B subunit gamma n=1 Tax=Hibiscus sabdariffa TaxID=183260 RepID=A0ABR2TCM5_9ROSI
MNMSKPLLLVANHLFLYYILRQIEQSNLRDLIVVVEGKDASFLVGERISKIFVDGLYIVIAAVLEDIEKVGALRVISHRPIARVMLVVSGDHVSDLRPGAVAIKKLSCKYITNYMVDVICKCVERGHKNGVILILEGLIKFMTKV